jgi:class 3 adenylate cyclase
LSPSDPGSDRFQEALIRQITRSRRKVTIMFTDVEGSTTYWEKHGDVHGRLMIDLHNRLIVPVIKKFSGTVVKHVGDAIMASFGSPEKALKAAVGIQQVLDRQRTRDETFVPEVRIGIHTGKAVVEKQDVFGDMVNVASRVGDHAIGGGICISGGAAAKVKRKAFALTKKGAFTPRGRKQNIQLYECDWEKCPSFIEDIDGDALPLIRRQKLELLVYALVGLAAVYLLCHVYLRPLIVESRMLALLALRLSRLYLSPPLLLTALAATALSYIAWRWSSSHLLYRLLKGGFGLTLAFLIVFLPARLLPWSLGSKWDGMLQESNGVFVEVVENDTAVRKGISDSAAVAAHVRAGDVLLVDDVKVRDERTWFKVALPGDDFGWLPEFIPPEIGVPEKQVASLVRFSFRYKDLYALLAGLLGFLWGFVSFRIRPA